MEDWITELSYRMVDHPCFDHNKTTTYLKSFFSAACEPKGYFDSVHCVSVNVKHKHTADLIYMQFEFSSGVLWTHEMVFQSSAHAAA